MTYLNYKDKTFEPITSSNLADLGLVKYATCSAEFSTLFAGDLCYGLHFMNATVSENNTTRITAELNGGTIHDYEVPLNCIDFHLYDSGFINFLAGSYYTRPSVNDSFFSIYEIVRDGNDIKKIREIYKIYGTITDDDKIDTTDLTPNDGINNPYVYTYVGYENGNRIEVDANGKKIEVDADGSRFVLDDEENKVISESSGKDMIFDCDWITNPMAYSPVTTSNDFNDKAFYFEVPVNQGEYAIGSTSGKTGAYLVYLDLAANAQEVERTRVDEKSETKEYSTTLPNGVSLLPSSTEGYDVAGIKSTNSAFVSIGSGSDNPITLSQSGNTVTDSGTGHTAVFIGSGIELRDGEGNLMTVPMANITKTITVETSTFYDTNIITGEETKTVIKTTTVNDSDGKKVSYTIEQPVKEDGQESTKTYGPYTTLPDLLELCKFTVDSDDAPPKKEFVDVLLNAQYAVSDTSKFALDFTYTMASGEGEEATPPSYAISATNETSDDVRLAIMLTSFGAEKGIAYDFNGTPITTTEPFVVTVEKKTAEN